MAASLCTVSSQVEHTYTRIIQRLQYIIQSVRICLYVDYFQQDEAWRVKIFNRFTIFDDSLVGVHIQKQSIQLNKPVYLGTSILDDTKALMSDFHYNFILK